MRPAHALACWLFAATLAPAAACARDDQTVKASALIGAPVVSPQGARLGMVAGVLLDARPRGVHYVLLSVEGRAGGEKRFAYPLNALRREGEALVINVSPRNLAQSPGYQGRNWPDLRYRSGEDFVRDAELLGRRVVDPLGNEVGDVHDFVLSLRTGHTQSVLVNFAEGGVLPMPAHAVEVAPGRAPVLKPDDARRA